MASLTPPLKPAPDSKIGAFVQPGKWDNREFAELDKLSESLNIELNAPAWLDLSGIPDMWARPLLFEIALFDMNHILHQRTVGEWRGLLALLAMREINNFRMRAEEVIIDSRNKFLDSLSKLKPQRVLDPTVDWSKLFVIYYNDKPIGITSPTTLVCTTASQINLGNIPWVSELRLCDPVDKLNSQKKRQLFTWIQSLENDLRNRLTGHYLANAHFLLQLLQEFMADLASTGLPISEGINRFQFDGIHRILNVPIAAHSSNPESHLAIKGNINAVVDQIIVADTAIASQWEVNPHEITIYGGVSLDQIPLGGFQNEKMIGPHALNSHRVWATNRLFTDKLYLFEQNKALPQAYIPEGGASLDIDGELCTPLLPVAKELLDYYTAEELSKRISYHMEGDGISVALRLTLAGRDGQPSDFRAIHKYTRSTNEIIHLSSVPLLAIWPNFISPTWSLYYSLYWDESETPQLTLTPITDNNITGTHQRKIRGGEVVQLNTFPNVYLAKYQDNYAGLILVKKPVEIPQTTNLQWKVGVDFGTTGTNVYFMSNQSGMTAQFPILKQRHIIVTDKNETDQLNLIFLPNKDQSKTFLSIFRDISGTGHDPYDPILDGHILYLSDSSSSLKKYEDKKEAGVLRDDLKWGAGAGDEGSHKLVKAFIEQLCIQTMAEAASQGVESVSWKFSYPSSFSYDLKNHFYSACRNTIEKCHSKSGLSGGDISFEPESVAAAKYFHDTVGGTFAAGAICIDIGGGTSDISIWRNKLIWQSSLRFAGRDIFTDMLQTHEDLSALLGLNKIPSSRYARIAAESSIRQDADSALNKLNEVFMKQSVKDLQQRICFSIAAIFYYVGMSVKKLISSGQYQISECPNIYIAGGGSKLFHWAAGGKYNEDHEIGNLFKHVFISAAGLETFPSSSKIVISSSPKNEAAVGLVNSSSLQFDNNSPNTEYLAGESIIINGAKIDWNEFIDAKKVSGSKIERTTPTSLINFINIFNSKCQSYAIAPIEYKNILTQLGMMAEEVFVKYGNQTELQIQLEPIFITYVKCMLKEMEN